MKLRELSDMLADCAICGDPDIEITGLATLDAASNGELTFLSNPKYRRLLGTTKASAVIVDLQTEVPDHLAAIRSPHPYLSFAHALCIFHKPAQPPTGIDPTARIAPTAQLGREVSIGPYTVIGEFAQIGDHTVIHSHCSIYPEAQIGRHCLIHSHCVVRERCRIGDSTVLQNHVVIGCDGFGYAQQPDQAWFKIPQTGIASLQDQVEVGAGTTIDRATLGDTVIHKGAKIDNLVQIGHGSSVGENTLLCAQVGLAGSTRVGRGVILGGQVGSAGHLTIGDRVVATAQSGIPSSVPEGAVVSGYPAINNRDWLKSSAAFAQLPELQRELRKLKARLLALEESLGRE
ncbi:MAG: UDP-3-O-(3-hydroxymyristoyl)glucosamine N-acyltransferase [Acidobacteria bacterium]|nr:UDP-3-O-(3-hydroxymyristoyl)glucosamine N-acyltransferase [Acidobacteriota bacterium]MCW5967082.1 UDP-3-O-(3-hydroxymyristoyl)glucosamine N-acyltransferase [Blastocatellales bacterium]